MDSLHDKPQIIEAEILDEQGRPLEQEKALSSGIGPQPHVRYTTQQTTTRAGYLTGFVALAFSVVFILLMAVLSVCIILPLSLLARILGLQIRAFRRPTADK